MTAANAAGHAQPGRQGWGQTNAADTENPRVPDVVYPRAILEMAEMARRLKATIYPAYRIVIDSSGTIYIRQPVRKKPAWVELQELIDP